MCSCIHLLVNDELFDYVSRICTYRSCLCFVCLFGFVLSCVFLNCGVIVLLVGIVLCCVCYCCLCLFVSFVFSLSRILFVKVLFCVLHGCSGHCHACHFCISGV